MSKVYSISATDATSSSDATMNEPPLQGFQDWLSRADVARQALHHTAMKLIDGFYNRNNPELAGLFMQVEAMDTHFELLLDQFEVLLGRAEGKCRRTITEAKS